MEGEGGENVWLTKKVEQILQIWENIFPHFPLIFLMAPHFSSRIILQN